MRANPNFPLKPVPGNGHWPPEGLEGRCTTGHGSKLLLSTYGTCTRHPLRTQFILILPRPLMRQFSCGQEQLCRIDALRSLVFAGSAKCCAGSPEWVLNFLGDRWLLSSTRSNPRKTENELETVLSYFLPCYMQRMSIELVLYQRGSVAQVEIIMK
ncbi:hypothetical protein LshimejAT787_0505600 [Lyophyllum shimeji]|uniref:Uncharacterized protein n=1 Tax=Lyophyllum shimeji TaxID=47721 RepID=A0A9P3UP76_LYOSH|nr:hypothetical protein LshimejAT787_0505600 [Lyophyllum shimeji]